MTRYAYTVVGEVDADSPEEAAQKAGDGEGATGITVNPKPVEGPRGGRYL